MLEEDGHAATCGDLHDGGGPRPATHGCGIRPGEPRHRPRLPVRPDGGDQTVGVVICPGYHDYVNLVNANGGVMGHRLRVDEVDHEYKVPAAMESYERFKKAGAVVIGVYGTPQIYALTQKLTEDRIPGTSPGFGKAAAADGSRYPYL